MANSLFPHFGACHSVVQDLADWETEAGCQEVPQGSPGRQMSPPAPESALQGRAFSAEGLSPPGRAWGQQEWKTMGGNAPAIASPIWGQRWNMGRALQGSWHWWVCHWLRQLVLR